APRESPSQSRPPSTLSPAPPHRPPEKLRRLQCAAAPAPTSGKPESAPPATPAAPSLFSREISQTPASCLAPARQSLPAPRVPPTLESANRNMAYHPAQTTRVSYPPDNPSAA